MSRREETNFDYKLNLLSVLAHFLVARQNLSMQNTLLMMLYHYHCSELS